MKAVLLFLSFAVVHGIQLRNQDRHQHREGEKVQHEALPAKKDSPDAVKLKAWELITHCAHELVPESAELFGERRTFPKTFDCKKLLAFKNDVTAEVQKIILEVKKETKLKDAMRFPKNEEWDSFFRINDVELAEGERLPLKKASKGGREKNLNERREEELIREKLDRERAGRERLDEPLAQSAARFTELESQTHLPENGPRTWPDRSIPYCVDSWNPFVNFVITVAVGMVRWNTDVKLVRVSCATAGHKIRFDYTGERPFSYLGMVIENDVNAVPIPSTYKGVKPDATDQRIGVALGAYIWPSIYVHEIIHALGFGHTHQRSDRLRCYTGAGYDEATEPGNCAELATPLHGQYDFESIMHYPTGNTCGDMIPTDNYAEHCLGNPDRMGHASGMSQGDIEAVNARYQGHDADNYD